MKLISALAVLASLGAAIPAFSAPITLDFEDQTSFASVSFPANVHGIAANPSLLALANDGFGPGANGEYFSNNPSGAFVMFATDPLPGERAEITTSRGFLQTISFYYSAVGAGSVYARDFSGDIVGTLSFDANNVDPLAPFSSWSLGTLAFSGFVHSIDFGNAVGVAAFDNVTVTPLSEPAAFALLPLGLAMLAFARRKRRDGAKAILPMNQLTPY